jgi:hypothetical protein
MMQTAENRSCQYTMVVANPMAARELELRAGTGTVVASLGGSLAVADNGFDGRAVAVLLDDGCCEHEASDQDSNNVTTIVQRIELKSGRKLAIRLDSDDLRFTIFRSRDSHERPRPGLQPPL